MKQFFESFGVVVIQTGGLALLALYSLVPVLLVFGGLMAAGRGIWSKGTESKDVQWAEEVLTYETDPQIIAIACDILRYCKS